MTTRAQLQAEEAAADRAAAQAAFARLPKGDLLLPYQQRPLGLLASGVSLLAIEKSRRIGLTWGLASDSVLTAGAQVSAGGQDVWYMGYNKDMALEFIATCAMWARAFGIAADAQDEVLVDDGDKGVQAYRIRFASGFKITALPSVARALRGTQGKVILDEAAFHDDLAEVLKAALALLVWGGQVVVVSTHDGVANDFNLLIDDIRSGKRRGRVVKITFDDAIADGLYERVALVAKVKGRPLELGKQAWIDDIRGFYGDDAEEELDCIPKAGSGSWLSPASIAVCEHIDAGDPELYRGGLLYLGRDVARRRDLAVLHGYEAVGDVLWLRHRWLGRNETFATQDAEAARIIRATRMARYWIDQTGMGEKVVEDEQRKYGDTRVTGVILSGPERLNLATSLKDRFDRGLIRIPANDAALRADLRAIKKKGGVGGSVSLVNEGSVHADEFWAAALACAAADIPYQPYAYEGIHGRDMVEQSQLARRRSENEGGGGFGGFRGYRF
jgi:phage FluMu gp28-like protein